MTTNGRGVLLPHQRRGKEKPGWNLGEREGPSYHGAVPSSGPFMRERKKRGYLSSPTEPPEKKEPSTSLPIGCEKKKTESRGKKERVEGVRLGPASREKGKAPSSRTGGRGKKSRVLLIRRREGKKPIRTRKKEDKTESPLGGRKKKEEIVGLFSRSDEPKNPRLKGFGRKKKTKYRRKKGR